ncbi:hypothetical protein E2562_036722 [Oryza meyeriana var. granulata]|uniref:Uncharacterized protein n=1 Tax=Oryza meyeriana var. granulata TaxID=110450 RepID=A0A6G1DAU4_9ORYZ|nr:hypothetical protein E2562_036722 [Oryza meyeriana var. granulata]
MSIDITTKVSNPTCKQQVELPSCRGDDLGEVTETVDYFVQASTIAAGNLFGRRRVIQLCDGPIEAFTVLHNIFYYAPKMVESWKGQKLLSRAEFHVGAHITNYEMLSFEEQLDIAQQIGTTCSQILSNFSDISLEVALYLLDFLNNPKPSEPSNEQLRMLLTNYDIAFLKLYQKCQCSIR